MLNRVTIAPKLPVYMAVLLVVTTLLTLQPLTRLVTEIASSGIGQLPLSFVPNAGQTDETVRFQVRSLGGTLFFTRDEVVLALPVENPSPQPPLLSGDIRPHSSRHTWRGGESALPAVQGGNAPQGVGTSTILRLRFEDANPSPEIIAGEALPGVVNYFLGNDPAQWHTDVPTYTGVVYRNLYAGIDLTYDGTEGLLKGTYTVAAGVDPSLIGWRYDGAESIAIDTATGDLRVALPGGNVLAEQKPTAWQEIGGARVPVDAGYTLADDGRVGFALGDYDAAYGLTIDPVLEYSTYLGGSSWDEGLDIVLDAANNAYVTGWTISTDFPTANAWHSTIVGSDDSYLAKFAPDGTRIYSTYFGGTGADNAFGIALDSSENIVLTGYTTSDDFPLLNPVQGTRAGNLDVYVVKLNDAGNTLLYSTYVGGGAQDSGYSVALDNSDNYYVTGRTMSTNFPTANAFQSTYGGGPSTGDVFVFKLNASGSTLVYSTYLGGSEFEQGFDIAVDNSGNAYVTGYTQSTNYPTVNAFQPSHLGGVDEAFIVKLDSDGSPIYSTYLGGNGSDSAWGITVDATGNAYVVGGTSSSNFPTVSALQPTYAGQGDAFISKFNPDGSALTYSTYLGGAVGSEYFESIALDSAGNIYVAGSGDTTSYPLVNPIQTTNAGSRDVLVAKLNSAGSALLFSTYLGGASHDDVRGLAVDSLGNIYITGVIFSSDFPTVNAVQPLRGGHYDGFVAKISLSLVVNTTLDDISGTCNAAHCSLREAILAANAATGTDTISFNISGAAPYTIALTSPLPLITDPVIIDGTTEPDFAGTPVVVLNGTALGAGVGTTCLPSQPQLTGLVITGGDSTVRGLVINGFAYGAVGLLGGGDNVVEGNYIGTNASGTSPVPNCYGVIITESADNRIGGTTAAARNIIAGNDDDGINIFGEDATNNVIQGNYIGTDVTGLVAMGNAETGIKIEESTGTLIGGTTPAERNIISDNTLQGVLIRSANGNTVQGNYIGTNVNGLNDLGNQHSGISLEDASNNIIGGTAAGAGNVIANNVRGVEVVIPEGSATGNSILGNSIHSNDELGINLGGDQVTANDASDGDAGPNNLQNFPVIDTATISAGSVTIVGTLNSVASTQYRLEFFADSACDASGSGEGRIYIGTTDVSTDGSGNASFSTTLSASLSVGNVITATATDPGNNTSEFSVCEAAVAPPTADLSVTQTDAPDPATGASPVTYTITVRNNGPAALTTVTLTDDLPNNASFSTATTPACSHLAGIVTCNLGALASGATSVVTVSVQPLSAGSMSNLVTVSGNLSDPNSSNNSDMETTMVIATPTPTSSPTITLTPSATYTPSNTPTPHQAQPTLTSTPLPSPPPALTATPYTPTDTPEPTDTPSLTPVPPMTATNTPPVSPTVTSTPLPSPPPT